MRFLLNVYRAQIKIHFALWFQYRIAMLLWMIGLVITPLVYLVVWRTVAETNGGSVNGVTAGEFAAYFIVMMVVNQMTYTWVMWEYDYIIRLGKLSPMLLRPFHPIHADIADNITYKLFAFFVIMPIALLLSWLFNPTITLSFWQVVAFIPALLMSFLIQFFLGWTVAILAFWTDRVSAANRIYFLGKLFLAGQLAPLAMLPPSLQSFAGYTPFPSTLAFPVELLLGWVSGTAVWQGLLTQLFWVSFAIILSQLVWRAGIRRYSAVGA